MYYNAPCRQLGAFIVKMIKEILQVSRKTNGRCFYCNKLGEAIDHFISKKKWKEWDLDNTPLRGGLDRIENLVLACKSCNSSKRDKTPEEFIGNSFMAWNRYDRVNKRVGLVMRGTI